MNDSSISASVSCCQNVPCNRLSHVHHVTMVGQGKWMQAMPLRQVRAVSHLVGDPAFDGDAILASVFFPFISLRDQDSVSSHKRETSL